LTTAFLVVDEEKQLAPLVNLFAQAITGSIHHGIDQKHDPLGGREEKSFVHILIAFGLHAYRKS